MTPTFQLSANLGQTRTFFSSSRNMLSTLRLIVTLFLLLFTLTVLGDEDLAVALVKKDEEDSTKPSEGQKRTSDPNNPWTRMSPWHFYGYTPYMNWYHPQHGYYHAGWYPMQPGYVSYPGVPQQPLSPLMSAMFPLHMAQSGHPWGMPPHHMPQVAYPGYQSYPGVPQQRLSPLMSKMFPLHMAQSGHPWGIPPHHMPQVAYPGYQSYPGVPQQPLSPLMSMMYPSHMTHSGHPWGIHHMPQAAYPRYPMYPGVFHQQTMSPLMSMMLHPSWHQHPVEAHPWRALAHVVHVPFAPSTPTPEQAFRWRYPGYYNPYYGHIWHHGHWPSHTSATFYPYKPQGGYCSFDRSFLCWGMPYCIKPKVMCDGVYDCPNHFDEHPYLCIAGRRPSIESIIQFLTDQSWIQQNLLTLSRPIDEVAKVLKSAESVEELRWRLNLDPKHVNNTRVAFQAAMDNRPEPLKALGMASSAMETVKYFLRVLISTGFRLST